MCVRRRHGRDAVRAEAIRQQQADALDKAEGCDLGFDMQPDPDSGPGMLWISSDGFGEPEHVIAFALACAEAFDLSGRWGFAWALTCSKPRINSFGGGAQILDLGRRASMDWVDTEHRIAEQLGKGEASAVLAETILRPVAEAQGWNRHSQLSVLLGFIDGLIADDPEIADRLRAHVAAASAADGDFTRRECGAEVFISDAGTIHRVGTGMDRIDHARDLAETSEMRSICAMRL